MKLGVYKNYIGKDYKVVGVAKNTETSEEMVVYKVLNGDGKLLVRPISVWDDIIEHDCKKVKRFTHIDDIQEEINGVHNKSNPKEKVKLFMSLFCHRDDVYAKR